MPALPSPLISLGCVVPPGAFKSESAAGLLDLLAGLPDPRARRGIRHRLATVVAAVVCAVVAGCRSYTAIGEWVADLPDQAAARLGMNTRRRPSESMIRRLLQVLDAEHLATLAGRWLGERLPEPAGGGRRAIAVDGKTLRGSASRDDPARHVLAAAEHGSGAVLAQTDVDGRTNEITRFAPLLDQISDLDGVVVTADALHCQRDHVTYLHGRGAHWVLTVKRNQPSLHAQLAALPWRAVPDGDRAKDRGHGRREVRTIKVLTLASGIDFPHAAQAIRIRRHRRRLDQPKCWKTQTTYAITDLPAHHGRPDRLAGWIRGHWHVENKVHWVRDVTYDEDRSQVRTGTGAQVMATIRNLAIAALRISGVTNIAAANRYHAHNPARPLDLLGIT
jgi:predicted transposase YbfD/YdcC